MWRLKHRQLAPSIPRLSAPSTVQNKRYGNILLYEIAVFTVKMEITDVS